MPNIPQLSEAKLFEMIRTAKPAVPQFPDACDEPIGSPAKKSYSNKVDQKPVGVEVADLLNRPTCKYLGECYRRNEEHLAQYAHPGDADYKPGSVPKTPKT